MKSKKKALSLLTCLAMTAGLIAVPNTAFAAEGETINSAATLQAAIDTAQKGDIIQLTADITGLTESITIPSDKKLTLDLQGKRLEVTGDGQNAINNSGDLTITGAGTVYGANEGIHNLSTGTLTIKNGNISGYWDAIWNQGTLYIEAGAFTGKYWHGIYNEGSIETVGNCTVSAEKCAIYSCGGDVTIESGTYNSRDSELATIAMYAIWDENEQPITENTLIINGGIFNSQIGSAVYVQENNTRIINGTFNGTVSLDGGYTNTIIGGQFKSNSIDGYKPGSCDEFVKNEETGYYEFQKVPAVVSYKDDNNRITEYADFTRAIKENIVSGGTFTLHADCSLARNTYEMVKDLTIDINGHNLTLEGTLNSHHGQIVATENTHLTIKNSSSVGKITFCHTVPGSAFSAEGGTITVDGVDIELKWPLNYAQAQSEGILAAINGGTINMSSGSITTVEGTYPAFSKDGTSTLNITGGRFNTDINDLLPTGYGQDGDGNVILTTETFTLTVESNDITVLVNGEKYTAPITCKPYQQVTLTYKDDPFHEFTDWGDETQTTDMLTFKISDNTIIKPNVHIMPTEEVKADGNVYTVTKPEQLAYLSWLSYKGETFAGKTIKLANNLNFNGVEYYPIGCKTPFQGTFDGNHQTISNLKMNTDNYAAVIGSTAGSAIIKDLTVQDSEFIPKGLGYTYAGIVGSANGATITNCNAIRVTVTGSWFAGAVAGHGYGVTITGSKVQDSTVGGTKAGGLIGFVGGSTLSDIEITGLTGAGCGALVGNINSGENDFENIQVNSSSSSTGEKLDLIQTSGGDGSNVTVTIGGEATYVDVAEVGSKADDATVNISGGTYTCPVEMQEVQEGYMQIKETSADGSTITKVVSAGKVKIEDYDKFVKDNKGNIRFIARTELDENASISGYGMWIIPERMFTTDSLSQDALKYERTEKIENNKTYSADLMNIPDPTERITAVPFIINHGETVQGAAYTATAQ